MTTEQLELISTDPTVMHGQAVLAGTRVPVSVILDCVAAGMTIEEIVAEYPIVTAPGVRAAAAYGRRWPARNCRCRTPSEVQDRRDDAITELANWPGLKALAGAVAVLQRGMLRVRHL